MNANDAPQTERVAQTHTINGVSYLVTPHGETGWRAVNSNTGEPIAIDALRNLYHESPEAKEERERSWQVSNRRALLRLQDMQNAEQANRCAEEVADGALEATEQLQRLFMCFLNVWATARRNQVYGKASSAVETGLLEFESQHPRYGLLARYTLGKIVARSIRAFCCEDGWELVIAEADKPVKEGNEHYAKELAGWVEARHKLRTAIQLLEWLKESLKTYRSFDAVRELSVPQEVSTFYADSLNQQPVSLAATSAPQVESQEPAAVVRPQKLREDLRDLSVSLDGFLTQGLKTEPVGQYTAKWRGKTQPFLTPSLDELCKGAGLYDPNSGKRKLFKRPARPEGKTRAVIDALQARGLLRGMLSEFVDKLSQRYALGLEAVPQPTAAQREGTNQVYSKAKKAVEDLLNMWDSHCPNGCNYEKIGQ